MDKVKVFEDSELVKIQNFYEHEICFYSGIARKDIIIPALANDYELSVKIVKSEVFNKNFLFTGLDGFGNHAPLKICDAEMYRFLFGREDRTRHMCREFFTEILEIDDKSAFNDAVIFELIRTKSEANMCAKYITEIEDMDEWKQNILVARCDYFLKGEVDNGN